MAFDKLPLLSIFDPSLKVTVQSASALDAIVTDHLLERSVEPTLGTIVEWG
ncbi:MAG: hypothetical protein M3R24_01695 [Chloroflexota bacterium]|nr:hypothetical protein [Chloroflexota bacterium]